MEKVTAWCRGDVLIAHGINLFVFPTDKAGIYTILVEWNYMLAFSKPMIIKILDLERQKKFLIWNQSVQNSTSNSQCHIR